MYQKPQVERFGSFRELTQMWILFSRKGGSNHRKS